MGTAAILLAGGSGTRLKHTENKVFADVAGSPLIVWCIRAFAACETVDQLIVVSRDGERDRVARIVESEGLSIPVRLTIGGDTRHASELSGLVALADDITSGSVDVVLIHDAARPFVTPPLISQVATAARDVGGAVPTLPMDDGIYRLTPNGGIAHEHGDLHRAQTPQGFRAPELLDAYRRSVGDGFTGVDTAQTVQRYTDLEVAAVAGEPTNIKVTYADDLEIAERIAAERP